VFSHDRIPGVEGAGELLRAADLGPPKQTGGEVSRSPEPRGDACVAPCGYGPHQW
jgi:hypothetical protein